MSKQVCYLGNKGFATILVLLAIVFAFAIGGTYYLGQKGIIPKFQGPAITSQTPAPIVEQPPTLPSQNPISVVSGRVVEGRDTTPAGLLDTPRKFVYRINTDDDSFVYVTYTAYPPSPFDDRKIRLSFNTGKIVIGNYLKARGRYDKSTSTLLVAEEDDYIETYPTKP